MRFSPPSIESRGVLSKMNDLIFHFLFFFFFLNLLLLVILTERRLFMPMLIQKVVTAVSAGKRLSL